MPDVTYLGSPNPSTFVRLLAILNEQREMLLESLAGGAFAPLDLLEAARRDVHGRATGRVARGRSIAREPAVWAMLQTDGTPMCGPRIRLLTTWTGGSCGIALDAVRRALPAEAHGDGAGLPVD